MEPKCFGAYNTLPGNLLIFLVAYASLQVDEVVGVLQTSLVLIAAFGFHIQVLDLFQVLVSKGKCFQTV